MAYVKQTWVNEDTTKPIDQTRLGHIEDGIFTAAATADVAASNASDAQDELTGRLSDASLHGKYPVHLVWDGSAYPTRVDGAVNIFFGPEHPGLAMDEGEGDYWANPDATTIAEVVTEAQDSGSDLYAAVQVAARPEFVEFSAAEFLPVDNRPATVGTLSPSANNAGALPALLFGDAATSVAGRTWRTPAGWSACRVYIDWGHTVASPTGSVQWQARIATYADGTDLAASTGLQTLTQTSTTPAVRVVKRMLIAGNFTLNPAGEELRLGIVRLSTTFGGQAGFIKMVLERTA